MIDTSGYRSGPSPQDKRLERIAGVLATGIAAWWESTLRREEPATALDSAAMPALHGPQRGHDGREEDQHA